MSSRTQRLSACSRHTWLGATVTGRQTSVSQTTRDTISAPTLTPTTTATHAAHTHAPAAGTATTHLLANEQMLVADLLPTA